jgi:hypothetical protein
MTTTDDSSKRPIFRETIEPNSIEVRQRLIKKVQEKLGTALIIYTANLEAIGSSIMIQDALLFEDVLRSVADKKKGTLMITSAGGDPNAAEKLMLMCRKRFTEKFQILVPFYAKSAATLMCLGADKILMGYGAELGPIDPQILLRPGKITPASAIIDSLKYIMDKIKGGDPIQLYYPMLNEIKPEWIAICQRAIEDSRSTAEKWLKEYMLKNNQDQAKQVTILLSDGKTYKSHGKPIDFQEAKNVLQLNVDQLDNSSEIWQEVWELFTRSAMWIHQNRVAKLFESGSASLNMSVNLTRIESPKE